MSRRTRSVRAAWFLLPILLTVSCGAILALAWWVWSGLSSQLLPSPTAISVATPTLTLPRSTPSSFPGTGSPSPRASLPVSSATPSTSPPAKEATLTPTLSPTLSPTPVAGGVDGDYPTEQRLLAANMPERDLRLLAQRLKKTGTIPKVVNEVPPRYELGDETEFWVGNVDTMEQFRVTAVLRYVTPHLYVWVEKGLVYDQEGLARSAENFEQRIYPTDRAFFGSEWTPGVDSDPHLHILHSTGAHMGRSVAGYYSSADEYSQRANPYSNEREMFYISLDGSMASGTDFYEGVLAHEFQHMIHWANDRNEENWVNEGCAELAAYLNGYDPGGFEWLFMADPDVQLTTWEEVGGAGPHYGNSYLFMAYFLGRFGEQALMEVVSHQTNGRAGFDAVLSGYGLTFDDVFADWVMANYLDNSGPLLTDGGTRYLYPDHVVGPVMTEATHREYPVQRTGTVHQYAADYIVLEGNGDLSIQFVGQVEARLVPVDAHSGRFAWWSNRGDDSNATLTRAFDLRTLSSGTLRAWMWYDIEQHWDYAYVEVSTDGGQTWDILDGPSTTTRNPNGNSFGAAYTGRSGGWIEESFDLTPYVGQEVLIRFEYVTDDAVNDAGWLIDDIRIPELGYAEDLEVGPGGWEGEGFVYSDNRVRQRYLVQLILIGDQVRVERLSLDEMQRGRVELHKVGDQIDSVVLVIAALAPVTTEIATYEYAIEVSTP